MHGEAVRRPDDGELVGYLVPEGAGAVPTTLVGTPLGGRQPADAARTVLVRPEWAVPEELMAQAVLPVPVGALLRAEPPA